MDLCLAYNMEEGAMESKQIEYLNLINLMYASRNMEKFPSGRLRYMISYMISRNNDIDYDIICLELSMIS